MLIFIMNLFYLSPSSRWLWLSVTVLFPVCVVALGERIMRSQAAEEGKQLLLCMRSGC
jgi:hypothetical protein